MKYLLTGLLVLPLLTSCNIVQEENYDQGYYNPPPQIEVTRPYRYYQDRRVYRAAPRERIYHGRPHEGRGSVTVTPPPAVTVIPPRSQGPRIQVQQQNVPASRAPGMVVRPGNSVQVMRGVDPHRMNPGVPQQAVRPQVQRPAPQLAPRPRNPEDDAIKSSQGSPARAVLAPRAPGISHQ